MSQQVSVLPMQDSCQGSGRLVHALLEASNISLPGLVCQAVSGVFGLNALGDIYTHVQNSSSADEMAEKALQVLDVTVEADFASIPAEGPLVIVSNHPFGMLEGLVLMTHLSRVRPDVRILANNILDKLASLPELRVLRDRLVPIDVADRADAANNLPGLRAALRHLEEGGALVVFPAGTVSHWQKGQGISDPNWRTTALRLSERCKARVVPLHFAGRNSLPFCLAGLVHPALRTLLLPRELLNKRGCTVRVRSGAAIDKDTLNILPSPKLRNGYLRMCCYALRDVKQQRQDKAGMQPIADHADKELVAQALEALPSESHLVTQGDYKLYVFKGQDEEFLLSEIGIAREETFRPCGEGTGTARDLDDYDRHYYHLLLWNAKDQAIAGAYRLGLVPEIMRMQKGSRGMYSASLFALDPRFLERYGRNGLELGRALVTAPYQRDFYPLLLLWKGIAAFICRYNLRYLFGPASLSLDASPASLDLITTMLASQYASPELDGLVKGRKKPKAKRHDAAQTAILTAIRNREIDFKGVDKLVRAQDEGRGIPVLFRHYLQLNGTIAAFHCDYSFNTLDAFLFVDLPKAPVSKLRRYMGDAEARDYLQRQQA